MTSRFGEHPPQPKDDELDQPTDDPPQRPEARQPERASQSSLWAEPVGETSVAKEDAASDQVWGPGYANAASNEPDLNTAVALAEPDLNDSDGVGGETYTGPSNGMKARRVAWELLQTLVLAALIFLMVRGVAQNFRVEGPSMEPGLHNGQYLLVNKAVYFRLDLDQLSKYLPFVEGGDNPSRYLFHGPQRGDVVVFRYPRDPSRDFIKRIIGVPGDSISIDQGVVTLNGEVLDEDYISPGATTTMDPKVVPVGSYFVMGDNRPNSSDSRNWGFVPEENIIGKAMFSYWPFSDLGGVGNTSIDLGFVKVPFF